MKTNCTKFLATLLAMALLILCIPHDVQAAAKKPELEKSTVTLVSGESYTIKLKNVSKSAKVKCTYKTNNKYVTVSKNGVVKAKNYPNKTTTITVKATITEKGKKAKKFTFKQTIKIAKAITLAKKTVTLQPNQKYTIKLANVPKNAKVKCSYSADNKYASVSKKGVVTAGKSSGKTTRIVVKATVTEKGKKAKTYKFNQTIKIVASSKNDNTGSEKKTNLSLGGIAKSGNFKIGLQYVKRMNYLPTALGEDTNIGAGNEVILPFFEAYNTSTSQQRIRFDDITCYADGVQVSKVDTYLNVECDGITQYYYADITGKAKVLSVKQFAVPKGWKQLKFFYGSDVSWTIKQKDVRSENYKYKSLFTNANRTVTKKGTSIYNKTHTIVFDGAQKYSKQGLLKTSNYVVFKFTVKNTGSSALDYDMVGDNMTAYRNNSYIGDADYSLNEQIDGYSNIFDIDSIQPGMISKVYVAFNDMLEGNDYYMIYDEGYITDDIKGSVYTIVN